MLILDTETLLPTNSYELGLKEIFDRNRISEKVKVFSVYLYTQGLSLRKLSRVLEDLGVSVSHVAIWKWAQKIGEKIREKSPTKRERKFLLVDETVIRSKKGRLWIFAAMDPENREIVELEVSKYREIGDVVRFFRKMLKFCRNRPVVTTDDGWWYSWPAKHLELEHTVISGKERNYIERWFKTLKNRLKNFDNYFPTKSLETIQNFIKIFQHWYNNAKHHQTINNPPLQKETGFKPWIKTLS